MLPTGVMCTIMFVYNRTIFKMVKFTFSSLIHMATLGSVRVRVLSYFLLEATDSMKGQKARRFG